MNSFSKRFKDISRGTVGARMVNKSGAFGGMRIGRGNRSTPRKPVPVIFCPSQILHDLNMY
jgi:hypothetical protein